jgi:uroporphyrin-III C-methyltransferase
MSELRGQRTKASTVYLVGAGPGAPDLLTLRAARILGEADIVFHDALVHPETLALAANAEKIAVGKRCGRHSTAQRFINKRLADAARRYRVVVRLKGGDPMLFGRAHEEISYLLEQQINVEVVPGVTAALAAAAEARVSLTRRGMSRSVVFATTRAAKDAAPSRWAEAVAAADTAVLYMASRDGEVVKSALLALGKDRRTPAAIVENASLPGKRIYRGTLADLSALAARCSGGPAVLLIGEVFAEMAAASEAGVASLLATYSRARRTSF